MKNVFLLILSSFYLSCFELNAMKYLSMKNETGAAIEKAEIIKDHSIAENS
jgi:hypothetical protein